MNKINSLHLAEIYARIFDIICSEKRTLFRERSSRKTVSWRNRQCPKTNIRAFICAKWRLFFIYILTWLGGFQDKIANFWNSEHTWIQKTTTKHRSLSWKPWSYVRISIHRTCPIENCKQEYPILGGSLGPLKMYRSHYKVEAAEYFYHFHLVPAVSLRSVNW